MQYALLIYAPAEDTDRGTRPMPGILAARLDRPDITGWVRLHAEESATTLRNDDGRVSRFPRALVRCRTDDGREGTGWIEWNQPDTT